ncbi:MAG: TlpA family protein disulfide reductase [Candidatus Dormibacteraeota bacterium]|nr:TlpA family protein disulfide reductase [Candidatus Dormibacteraeota bacterium]
MAALLRSNRPPGRTRALLAGAVVAVAVVVAAVAFLVTRAGPAPSTTSFDPAAWSLPRLNGPGEMTLASFHGRPLVLDFFASWCTSCNEELPAFVQTDQRLGGRVGFAGVDSEETGDGLAFARQTGVGGWPLARDLGGRELSGLRDAVEATPGMPVTAFYDASGKLLHVQLGALTSDQLLSQISRLYNLSPP